MTEDTATSSTRAPSHPSEPAAEWVPTCELRPWRDNPPQNDPAVAAVMDYIKRFGFGAPIIARLADGEVIAGHAPAVPLPFLATATADPSSRTVSINFRTTGDEVAEWDEEALGRILAEPRANEVDLLAGTGFGEEELDALIRDAQGLPSPGVDPGLSEPPPNPVSKPGEVYELGGHRLMCGDSTSAEDVARLMAGERAVLCVTDPPYLVDYDGTNHPHSFERDKAGKSNNKKWDAYRDPETSVAFYASFLWSGRLLS